MKVIDLNGTSHSMGFQQGIQLREQFELMLEDLFASDLWKKHRPFAIPRSVVMPAIGAAGAIFTKHTVKKYLPEQYNRVKGLAKGLSIRENRAWGVQFLEIMFCEAGNNLVAPLPGGCTQMHALARATVNDAPLLARNYDFPNLLGPYQIVRRGVPSKRDRLATVTVTQLPIIGAHHGINEAGLAAAANNARLWKGRDLNRSGVPYELILLEILETCGTVREAVDFITKFPARGNAGFFGFMDERGDCRLVEFTASRHAVRRPDESGTLAQSNHYHVMADANLPEGTYWSVEGMEKLEYSVSTKSRFEAADRLMHEAAGKITVETLKSILRDHSANDGAGNDNTVCAHGESGGTLAGIIADATNGELWVADGNPCENEFQKVKLRTR